MAYIKNHFDVGYYSSEGAVTNIGGDHYYYLETRDALTLELLKSTKLEGVNVESPDITGKSATLLWIFNKQIKAFDPFTHTLVCNAEKLIQLNPALRNNLPDESKYYTFDYTSNRLEIFTKNAARYAIGEDFIAIPVKEDVNKESPEITQLKAKIKETEADRKNTAYNAALYDTIRKMERKLSVLQDEYNNQKEFRDRLNEMLGQTFSSIDRLIINASIHDSMVYGLLPLKEMDTTSTSFSVQQSFYTEEQRYLGKAPIKEIQKSQGLYNWMTIGKWSILDPKLYFIKGNFLVNKQTLEAITLQNPKSWLIISVKEIGQNSPFLIHRVDTSGKILWRTELPITNFNDLLFIPDKAVVLCSKPAPNDDDGSDKLLTVDIKTGNYSMIDLNGK